MTDASRAEMLRAEREWFHQWSLVPMDDDWTIGRTWDKPVPERAPEQPSPRGMLLYILGSLLCFGATAAIILHGAL